MAAVNCGLIQDRPSEPASAGIPVIIKNFHRKTAEKILTTASADLTLFGFIADPCILLRGIKVTLLFSSPLLRRALAVCSVSTTILYNYNCKT